MNYTPDIWHVNVYSEGLRSKKKSNFFILTKAIGYVILVLMLKLQYKLK